MSGVPNAWAANQEFNSREFHARVLLPFYDHYLKGTATDYIERPEVEYAVRGSTATRTATQWPPATVQYQTWYLGGGRTGSVTSLNDGTLSRTATPGDASTSYTYPNPGWVSGVAGFGPSPSGAAFDPVRRVLTFTTPALEEDLEIAGPIKLVLFAASTADDTDFFVNVDNRSFESKRNKARTSIFIRPKVPELASMRFSIECDLVNLNQPLQSVMIRA